MRGWRLIFLGLALAFCAGAGARAAELRVSKPEVRREVVAVVEAQLAAFRAGDVERAWSHASVALRASRPLSVFGTMVRDHYAEIWANTRAEYGLVRDDGAQATLAVHVYAGERSAAYEYSLVMEQGRWRISAVLRQVPTQADKL